MRGIGVGTARGNGSASSGAQVEKKRQVGRRKDILILRYEKEVHYSHNEKRAGERMPFRILDKRSCIAVCRMGKGEGGPRNAERISCGVRLRLKGHGSQKTFSIQRIQTDRGREFFAEKFQWQLMGWSFKFRPIKPALPHLNGKVERVQKAVLDEFYASLELDSPDDLVWYFSCLIMLMLHRPTIFQGVLL